MYSWPPLVSTGNPSMANAIEPQPVPQPFCQNSVIHSGRVLPNQNFAFSHMGIKYIKVPVDNTITDCPARDIKNQ